LTLGQQVLSALATSGAGVQGAVVDVDGVGRVVSLRETSLIPPASTEKLYTAGAALLRLGPDTRLTTTVRRAGPIGPDGVLNGNIVFVAKGDPTLDGGGLDDLAAQVVRAGVHHVTGAIVVNDTHFDRLRSALGWKPGWVPNESGPLSAFALDRNRWSTASGYLANPNLANGDRFREALSRAGVTVAGPTRIGPSRWSNQVIASRPSPTIAQLVRSTMKDSDNFAAELLLKEVGARTARGATTAGGVAAVKKLARSMGAPIVGPMADGSGLSSLDLSRPADQLAWLTVMGNSSVGPIFRDSLPTACVDGTLKQRMCGTPAAGRVQAKTGTLPGVVTLTGYTTTTSGRPVRFSILLASAPNSIRARDAIDRAVVAIAAFAG
jgi:D-alanyl-D-alanine carboxypeptidase/D-alanyl-D-alanine-endopeptidase (penicillin-binding protein 4)